jgi:hypothetical protein
MLVNFKDILSILLPYDRFCGRLAFFVVIFGIFFPFWYVAPRTIWQPCPTLFAHKQSFFLLRVFSPPKENRGEIPPDFTVLPSGSATARPRPVQAAATPP